MGSMWVTREEKRRLYTLGQGMYGRLSVASDSYGMIRDLQTGALPPGVFSHDV